MKFLYSKNNKEQGSGKDNEKKADNQQNGKKGKDFIKGPSKSPQKFWGNILSIVLIFLILITAYSMVMESRKDIEEVSISQLATDIKQGDVEKINVEEGDLKIFYADDTEKKSKKETEAALSETLRNYGVSSESINDVEINIKGPSGFEYWARTVGPFLIPLVLIIFIFWFLTRQVKGASMQAFSFGQSKARLTRPEDDNQKVTFKDVADAKEAKEELSEVVDFLKNPKKFLDIGARIPKGMMLIGPPGTGKTLLARAVAGEAGVPFYSISGSEFVEMFVGVGASRTRDLFKQVKRDAPAIIFIDELDAIGRIRGAGTGGGHDEREQTLNQILVEMDGFEPTEKVVVLAATNRPDVLDPALLRPGRFDRRAIIDLPDRSDREEILKVHARKKPLAEDVDISVVAERTPGFSGADLYSLMNEAAIYAARQGRKKIKQEDILSSIEKVMLGPERKSHVLTRREKEIAAYHEAGHALLSSVLEHTDPVHKVSIIARGQASGYTLKLPFEDKKMRSKKEFLDDMAVSLGGYITEKLKFDDLTTGASNDLQVISALARDMVTKYGMSEKIGPVSFDSGSGQVIRGTATGEREYSEQMTSEIDEEVSRFINEAHERAKKVLKENDEVLEGIAQKLMEAETLERVDFEEILREYGINPKEKSSEGDSSKEGSE